MSDTESPGTARIMYEREQEQLAKAKAQERLEAAAPALLAACEKIKTIVDERVTNGVCFDELEGIVDTAIKAGRGE